MRFSFGRATSGFIAYILALGMAGTSLPARAVMGARSGHQELRRQRGLARAEGIPLTESQFRRHTSSEAGRNAAPLYRKAVSVLQAVIGHNQQAWSNFDPYKLDIRKSAEAQRKIVSLAAPALNLVARAGRMRTCDLNLKPGDLGFPMFSGFKLIAKIAVRKAKLLEHDGHPAQALRSLATFAPLSGHLSQSPGLIVALVQCAVDGMFTSVIGEVLAHHGREPGVAAAAARCIRSLGRMPDLVRVAEAEGLAKLYYLGPEFIKPSAPGKGRGSAETEEEREFKNVGRLAKLPGMADRWRALEIETTRRYVALFRTFGGNWLRLEHKAAAADKTLLKPDDEAHAWRHATGAGGWSDFIDVVALSLSHRRVLAQAAALLEAPSPPATLPMKGATAQDPLSNHSYHYSRTPAGFKIYGVGRHGVDHGGKPRAPKLTPADYDVVFAFPAKQ